MIHGIIYIIYPIVPSVDMMMYVGSTERPLMVRWAQHKYTYENGTTKLYKYIRDNGGIEAFTIGVVEERDFHCRSNLLQRESFHIRRIPNKFSLNTVNVAKPEGWQPSSPHVNSYYTKEWQNSRKEYRIKVGMWNEHEQKKYDKAMMIINNEYDYKTGLAKTK